MDHEESFRGMRSAAESHDASNQAYQTDVDSHADRLSPVGDERPAVDTYDLGDMAYRLDVDSYADRLSPTLVENDRLRPPQSASECFELSDRRTMPSNARNAGQANVSHDSAVASPDGGYGWVVVVCSMLINAHTFGLVASYGVILSYYLETNYFSGTTKTTYAFIGGLQLSQAVLTAPLSTYLALSLVTSSFAKKAWQAVLSEGIVYGWGTGFLFVGSVAITSQWFEKKRSLANAIVSSGTGFGALIYSLATRSMIDTMGLRWAFRILAIVCFIVNSICAALMRDRNAVVGSKVRPFSPKLMKKPEFLCLQAWSLLTVMGYTGLAFSVSAQAISVGVSAENASLLTSLYNLGQAIGRPLMGLGSDYFGRINIALLATILSAVFGFLFWIPSPYVGSPMALLVFFNIVSGTVTGVFWCTIAAVTTEVVGLPELPAALSMIWLTIVPSTMFAEVIVLALESSQRLTSFIPPQVYINMMFILAIPPMLVVRGWKIMEMERLRSMASTGTLRPLVTTDLGKDSKVVAAAAAAAPAREEAKGRAWRKFWMRMFDKMKV